MLQPVSKPEQQQFVFAYTINIQNNGQTGATLLSRHWVITDANGHVQEVKGNGVVGEQPYIGVGESFQYSSGTVLNTPVGTMEGSYMMQDEDGVSFSAPIPVFSLAVPGVLH